MPNTCGSANDRGDQSVLVGGGKGGGGRRATQPWVWSRSIRGDWGGLSAQAPGEPAHPDATAHCCQRAPPAVPVAWRGLARTSPSVSKAHPSSSGDAEKSQEGKGKPWAEHPPPGPAAGPGVCRWLGAWSSWRGRGTVDRWAAWAGNSFASSEISVLSVGKWFSIESIIFLSLNIYLLKLYLFVSLGKSASAHSQ